MLTTDPDININPYKPWIACCILLHLFEDSTEIKDRLRNVTIGDEANGEELVTVIQSLSSNLSMSLKKKDPRISIAYFMLLSVWLFDDVEAVNDFLQESSTIQTLLYVINHTSGHALIEPIATILIGIVYDFSGRNSPISRSSLYSIFKNNIGRDQYVLKVQKLKHNPMFKDFEESQIFNAERDETGLPNVFFDKIYVDLIKDNFSRIKKSFDRDPESEPNSRISLQMY